MQNEPDKWPNQMWVIPGEVRLQREKDDWTLQFSNGAFKIFVPTSDGEQLARWADAETTRLDRKYRNSLAFKWQRFWYLRRKKRQ